MEQRFDHETWLDQNRDARQANEAARPLDWHALAARLCAGHAFQRAMAESDEGWVAPGGSFDPVAAQQIIDYAASAPTDWGFDSVMKAAIYPDINPIVLGVRKSMSGTELGVVSQIIPAIEG
jgi:hypothetical protein